jgi:Na+-translocating ferredoxin:NAD+ oxidoreductase RnfC subunit
VIADLERPIGKKAQNEREKTQRRQDQMSANLVEVVNDMKEEQQKYIRLTKERLLFEQSREEREKEVDLLSKKMLEMEQSREDRKIMSMDTSNMSPMKKNHIFVHVKWKSLKNIWSFPFEID